jgi:hypothetical protein
MRRILPAIIFAFGFCYVIPVRADLCGSDTSNLVQNCGFEVGSFAGWNLSGVDSGPAYDGIAHGVDQADAYSGNYGAYLGGFGGILNLSQIFATTPGTGYTVSYWLAQSPATPAPYQSSFSASFGGSVLTSISQASDFPFTRYSFNVVATSSATNLLFGFRDDTGFFSIDDVQVTPVPTPEPDNFGMLAVFIAMGVVIWRCRSVPKLARVLRFKA